MPNFTFTGPQGQQITVTGPDGSTPEQAFQIAQQHLAQQNNPTQTKVPGYQASDTGQFTPSQATSPIKDAITNVAADTIRHQGIPLDTISQGVNAVTDIPRQLLSHKVDQFNKIQSEATRMMGKPQGDYGAQSNAVMQAGADIAGNLLPMAVTPEAEAPKAASLAEKALAPVSFETNPVLAARQAGYPLPPSEAFVKGAPSLGGRVMEGLSGSAKLRTDAAIKAKNVTNDLGAEDLGLPKGTALTSGTFAQLRKPENSVYSEVENLSQTGGPVKADSQYQDRLNGLYEENKSAFGDNPDIVAALKRANQPYFSTSDLLKEVKTLRGNARSNYRSSENPSGTGKDTYSLGDLADVQQGIADALEDQLGRWVQHIPGKQDLLQRWQQARVNLAKINTYDNAIREGSNDISASLVARQVNKAPQKFTGNAVKIADMYNNFPRVVVDPKTLGNKTPLNMWESSVGGLTGIAALYLHNPALGAAATTAFLARPGIRAGLLSNAYQNSLANAPKALSPLDLLLRGQTNRLMTGGATNLLQNPLLGNQ